MRNQRQGWRTLQPCRLLEHEHHGRGLGDNIQSDGADGVLVPLHEAHHSLFRGECRRRKLAGLEVPLVSIRRQTAAVLIEELLREELPRAASGFAIDGNDGAPVAPEHLLLEIDCTDLRIARMSWC